MNDDFLENVINSLFWKLILAQNRKELILISADHNYRYYPGKYFIQVFQRTKIIEIEKSQIELELKKIVMKLTGLSHNKVIVHFYLDNDIIELI